MKMTLIMPWPDHRLSSNGRGDRRGLTGLRRQARENGYLAACEAGRELPAGALALTMHFFAPDRRRRDLLNLAEDMKSVIDGIFQACDRDDSEIRRVTLIEGEAFYGGQVMIEVEGA